LRLLIDGISYAQKRTALCRLWTYVLRELALRPDVQLFILDRGSSPDMPGVQLHAFPSYTGTYTASDSLLIQQFCDQLDVDVFCSTGYTSAVTTPQVQLVYDLIAERPVVDLPDRILKEKQLALSYAAYLACPSNAALDELLTQYPHLDSSSIIVAQCGVDQHTFHDKASHGVASLRQALAFNKPYYVYVACPQGSGVEKRGKLLFDSLKVDQAADFDILWVGEKHTLDTDWLRDLPPQLHVRQVELSETELASAYAGALALIYPSFDSAYGMPIAEAMASGCPIITIGNPSLDEAAGDATLTVPDDDAYALLHALERARDTQTRQDLIAAGFTQAATLSWEGFATRLFELLNLASLERDDLRVREFHRHWKKLRMTQANVDVGID